MQRKDGGDREDYDRAEKPARIEPHPLFVLVDVIIPRYPFAEESMVRRELFEQLERTPFA
jgi:hypothetical protein